VIMQLTPDQQRAIYAADTNLIVTAGAGSGKTRVLVERFLTQLQHNPHWSLTSIVAITFTEKAAREMRDRIRQRIMAYLEEPAEDHHFWRRHEAALEGARIGTIHALCTQILRANPVEARLDPAFQILDEVEAAILCDEAVERALAQMLEENAPALALLAHYDTQTLWHVLRTYAGRAAAEPLLSSCEPGRQPGSRMPRGYYNCSRQTSNCGRRCTGLMICHTPMGISFLRYGAPYRLSVRC
jgi:ATP-dependent helicase/nuclease subunit A